MASPSPVGRHRARIHALQTPSEATRAYAAGLHWQALGPGALAVGEWQARGLRVPDLDLIRRYRLDRVRAELRRRDWMGIVLYDPINIRYATDSMNMQVWILHNANRYCYVPVEGPVVVFEYETAEHLNQHLPLVDEVRTATSWYYMAAGDQYPEKARLWAAELADLVRRDGGGNRRLALDRCNPAGLHALEAEGLTVCNGEEVMEHARLIKHPEEIVAMRCAIAACETAMAEMQRQLRPGLTEQDVWAILHAENIRRGGEWIETRLLSSGPRTNPWFQECSSRVIEPGDLVAFDTDLIGPYGVCVDISRTWRCGDGAPSAAQAQLWDLAADQIRFNTPLLRPGVSWHELSLEARRLPLERYRRYTVLYHAVGLADEYPGIAFPEDWATYGLDGVLEPGMVFTVESYVGERRGGEGVKLEEQVLVTETGFEQLSSYPLRL